MWRHLKTCLNKDNENYNNNNFVEQSEMLLYSSKYGDGAYKELKALVLVNMIRDEVYDCLVKDYWKKKTTGIAHAKYFLKLCKPSGLEKSEEYR